MGVDSFKRSDVVRLHELFRIESRQRTTSLLIVQLLLLVQHVLLEQISLFFVLLDTRHQEFLLLFFFSFKLFLRDLRGDGIFDQGN